jgi:hypothetical protein
LLYNRVRPKGGFPFGGIFTPSLSLYLPDEQQQRDEECLLGQQQSRKKGWTENWTTAEQKERMDRKCSSRERECVCV